MSVHDDTGLVTITAYPDGPYLVRGDFRIVDHDGIEIPRSRRTIALCRCGKSRMRPFCDGTHRLAGFRAAGAADRCGVPARPQSDDARER
jgi:CDGSH-type Zn-finger protein